MSSPDTWADVDACTLPTAERPLRVAELDDLFATVTAVERPSPTLLRLVLAGPGDLLGTARDLAARESACCSFFTFTVTPADGGVRMDVSVPAARVDVLDALAERAS
ncbi:hypothetical protein EKO23_11260 [Nocardioides guangzhouensis]|uniref:Arsenate reductase n=1 Tax=Nocardioides guangzhouensis TaxID=2497878 RepID=A0A4Q4ZER1_9ACTN|nr:hypothetical protein [Nocardioides guangzhouensis]RYP85881.1 hypothetical protein EKO23_11260 [Nocardioides guangzhouensis]